MVYEYADIGKAARDLLSKDFNFGKTKIEAKTTTSNGVVFTTTLDRDTKKGTIDGEVKAKYSAGKIVLNESFRTNNDLNVKAELSDQIIEGLKVDVDATFNPYDSSKSLKIATAFSQSHFKTTSNFDALKLSVKADANFSFDKFVGGAQASYDINGQKLEDSSAAIGYDEKDFNVSFHAQKHFSEFVLGYHQKVNSDLTFALQGKWSEKPTVEVGASFKVDNDTTFKTKVDNSLKVGLGYSTKVRSDLKVTVGLELDATKLNEGGHRFGLAFNFEPK
jgi:voltage-dependent anion channel protein 2